MNKMILILILSGWTIASSYGNIQKCTTTSSYIKTSLTDTSLAKTGHPKSNPANTNSFNETNINKTSLNKPHLDKVHKLNKNHKTQSKTQIATKATSKFAKTKKAYMCGIASYYGGNDGFEGKPMANGQIFHSQNPNLSAHPTLPLGTKLKVTAPVTNRSIYVEVTDRMPKQHRVIDLSKSAAKELGIKSRGTAYVELTVVSNMEYQLKKNTIEEELTE